MMDINELINKITCADCMDILKQLPDKCIELCCCDPPYGIGISKQKTIGDNKNKKYRATQFTKKVWDSTPPSDDVFAEIMRVSKHQIIWGGQFFPQVLSKSKCWLVWDKGIRDTSFADCEIAYTSFDCVGYNNKIYKFDWSGYIQGYKEGQRETRIHPCQKPVALLIRIIEDFSKEGDLILDCFSGSGSVALASEITKRRFICIEKDEEYFQKSMERLEQHRKQLTLF